MGAMTRCGRVRDVLLTAALNVANAPPASFFYGGQAVIEGVLMRGKQHYAVAARRPDGSIALRTDVLRSRVYTKRFWSLPFVRGVAGLYEMVHLGLGALEWSARIQMGEEIEIPVGMTRAAMGVALVFGLGLFIVVPLVITNVLRHSSSRSVTSVLIEGGIRAAVLILYLLLIGTLGNIKRVFQYHGAEHQAINCLESGKEVDVANVRRSSRLHPRCGTGFIVVVALVSVIVFAPLGLLPVAVRIACQIVLIPVVAGISYEAIRGLARIRYTRIGKILLGPVLATQLLSTRRPDDQQIEVAIRALDAARAEEESVGELAGAN